MPVEDAVVKDLESKIAEGDTEAMCTLGLMCLSGDGIEQNRPRARKLLTDAAETGDLKAIEGIISYYLEDKPEEWIRFVEYWCRRAIIAGNDSALLKLADFYYSGDGESNKDANKLATILYVESAKKNEDDCERETTVLGRMLEYGWLDTGWKFYGEALEVLAEHGNRDAKRIIRRDEVPEPEDDFDFNALLEEKFDLPEVVYEVKSKPVRRWGRATVGKRALTSYLYEMGIEFTKSSNGMIKTKKGLEIQDDIEKLIAKGYKFKYSNRTDKWTIMDKSGKE